MKRLIFAATFLAAAGANAQTPQIVAVSKGDSVVLFVTAPPQPYYGFVVHGTATDTVRPERDPQQLALRIGSDLQAVLRATSTDNPLALMRHIDGDNFASNLLSILYPSVGRALARTWREGGKSAGSTVDYQLDFLDARGRTAQTINVQARVADVLPVAPTALSAKSGDMRITLRWSYPQPRTDGTDFTFGFNVYRATGVTAPLKRINEEVIAREPTKTPSYTDFGVVAGKSYRYAVRALDIVGREGPPVEISVVLRDSVAPAPTTRVTAQVDKERVALVWPMAPEPDAAGYHVERSTGLDKPYMRLTKLLIPVDQPAYTDATAHPDIQYFYRVVTVDSARNESIPSNPESAFPLDRTAPAAPSALRATLLLPKHHVSVQWLPSPSNDVVGYFVYRHEKNGPTVQLTSTPVKPPFIDQGPDSVGLTVGRTYTLSVAAVDGAQNQSPQITTDIVVPDDQPPLPATGFNIENVQGRYAIIQWSVSPSGDVKSYELKRADKLIAAVGRTSARVVRDTAIAAGNTYAYSLVAIDSAGNRSSAVVDTLSFRDPTPPSAPRNAYARRTAEGVRVGWERVPDADLDGYLVYRSDLPTGVFTQLTDKPVRALTFMDKAGPPDAWYVVRAVDASRNRSAASPAVKAIAQ